MQRRTLLVLPAECAAGISQVYQQRHHVRIVFLFAETVIGVDSVWIDIGAGHQDALFGQQAAVLAIVAAEVNRPFRLGLGQKIFNELSLFVSGGQIVIGVLVVITPLRALDARAQTLDDVLEIQ